MKKLITILATLTLFISSYGTSFAYDDVPNDSQYYYSVDYLRRNGVFKETRLFKPDTIISKAEFIKYLVLLNSRDFKPSSDIKLPFADTNDNSWYAPYFHEAIALGILSDRETKIYPYKKLSVVEALELLFHSQSIPIPRIFHGDIQYEDVKRNKRYAPLIMRALDFDLIKPEKPDYLGIYHRVSKAEAAFMMYKMDLINLTSPTSPNTGNVSVADIELQKIMSVWEIIFNSYIGRDDLFKDDIADSAIRAMMKALDDPYSVYFDTQENASFADGLEGEVEGIGAYIEMDDDNQLVIVSPIIGSPSQKAGLRSGDIIWKVDGKDISEMNVYEATALIKGPKGTTVSLTIKRNGNIKIINVKRDIVKIDSLNYEVKENGKIMVVSLNQFSQNSPSDFQEVVEIIQNNSQIKGIIIDVRDNPGGLLDSAVGIINHLLRPESEIVTIQYNYFNYTQYANGGGELANYPMAVLINKGSASASEILAGALKDFDSAKIIGETSYGKGSVQEVNYFVDNSSVKLTIAEWLTPLNHSINGNGISPDIKVLDNPHTEKDEQMERAIKELNKMIK
jgi:carboxyl-terminal processing protease